MPTQISDSGGYEGSSQVLTLEQLNGSLLEYYFDFYSIPDRFVVMYEGNVIFDSGFTGGSRSGVIELPQGTSMEVQINVYTDDEGTAWEYSVEATSSSTYPFILAANGADFVESETSGIFVGTGTISIGREDGLSNLITVQSGSGSYDEDSFTTQGTFYFDVGGVSQAIFTGSFSTPFDSGSGAVTDNGGAGYQLAGIDIEVSEMKINPNDIRITVDFQLSAALGNLEVEDQTLIFNNNGVFLGVNSSVELPDAEFSFLNLFDVSAADQKLSYNHTNDMLKYQGELTIDGFTKFLGANDSITVDLSGDNYVGISANAPYVELVGSLTYDRELKYGAWGLKQLEITADTSTGEVSGSVTVTLPMRLDVTGTLGFLLSPDLQLNKIEVEVSNINKPIGFAPGVFLQSISGVIDHIAKDDSDPISFTGGVGFSGGPKIGGQSIATLDVEATIDEDHIEGEATLTIFNDEIFQATGHMNWNWGDGYFTQNATVNILDGFITGTSAIRITSNFDVDFGGRAQITLPENIPFLGGDSVAADYVVHYANNGTLSDDYAQAYFQATWTVLGIEQSARVGVRYGFDGSINPLGFDSVLDIIDGESASSLRNSNEIGVQSDTSILYLSASWTIAQSGDVAVNVIDPDGNVINQADFASHGIDIVEEFGSDYGKIVAIATPAAGNWQIVVVDETGLGTVEYWAGTLNDAPTVAITSVSAQDADGVVDIQYTSTDADGDATISLYYDADGDGQDGILIAADVAAQSGPGVYHWDARGVAPGAYHVYAVARDEVNAPSVDYSDSTVSLSGSADLSVSITGPDAPLVVGSTAAYTITVLNTGPDAAEDVLIEDIFPANATLVSSSITPISTEDGRAYFSLASLASGASQTITVVLQGTAAEVVIDPDIVNDSIATAISLDEHFALFEASNVEQSDVLEHVTISAVGTGTVDYYAFTVGNDNDSLIFDIDGTENLDSHIRIYDSAGNLINQDDDGGLDPGSSSGYDSWLQHTFSAAGTYYIGVFRHSTDGVTTGEPYKLNISRPVSDDGDGNDQGTHSVAVSSAVYDTDFSNNSDFIYAGGGAGATDLVVSATPFAATVGVGEAVSTVFTITNDGSAAATAVQLSALFARLGGIEIEVSQGSYSDQGNGSYVLDLGTIAAGGTATVTVSGNAMQIGALSAQISAFSDQTDDNPDDNELTLTTTVQAGSPMPADLSLSMDTADRDSEGRQIITISLANNGPGAASNIAVLAPMLTGTTLWDAYMVQGTYDANTGIWQVGNMRDGITRDLELRVDAVASSIALFSASIVTSDTDDPDSTPGNNVDGEDDQVSALVALGNLTEMYGDTDGETVIGGDLDDAIYADAGNDTIRAKAGNDVIFGGSGLDKLYGDSGNDWFHGGDSNDLIVGGAGNDTVTYVDMTSAVKVRLDAKTPTADSAASGTDRLNGIENVVGGSAGDIMIGSRGGNGLYGLAGNDQLTGGNGSDILDGGSGNDKLTGGTGDDLIIAGTGKDTLFGNAGKDKFVFVNQSDSSGVFIDTISDFNDAGNDTIDLTGLASGLSYISANAFTGVNQVRINDIAGADVTVEINLSGDLGADMTIRLARTTFASMSASDFLL